jgi:hypothetical protein
MLNEKFAVASSITIIIGIVDEHIRMIDASSFQFLSRTQQVERQSNDRLHVKQQQYAERIADYDATRRLVEQQDKQLNVGAPHRIIACAVLSIDDTNTHIRLFSIIDNASKQNVLQINMRVFFRKNVIVCIPMLSHGNFTINLHKK